MTAHQLDLTTRPASCTCGRASFAGSPTFVRERFAVHVATTTATPATAHDERTSK